MGSVRIVRGPQSADTRCSEMTLSFSAAMQYAALWPDCSVVSVLGMSAFDGLTVAVCGL